MSGVELAMAFLSGVVTGILLRAFFWAPEAGARRRAERDRVPYLGWAQEGWITLTPGDITDYRAVRAGIHDIAERVVLRAIGYDRWNAAQIVTELGDDGFFMIPVGQGYASLATPSREIETFVIGGLIHHDGNPVLRWMVGNVNAETDPAGNLKPSREKSTDRIMRPSGPSSLEPRAATDSDRRTAVRPYLIA